MFKNTNELRSMSCEELINLYNLSRDHYWSLRKAHYDCGLDTAEGEKELDLYMNRILNVLCEVSFIC